MPYAHKYANAVTEHGMIEALRMFLPQDGAVSAMLKGGMALASKDIEAIMQLLIDADQFKGPKGEPVSIAAYTPSFDGRYIAFEIALAGAEIGDIHVLDTTTGLGYTGSGSI